MMRGVLEKIVREVWLVVLLFALGLGLATGLITSILPELQEGLNEVLAQVPFIRAMVSAMMGIDLSGGVTAKMMLAVAWSHPTVLAVFWVFQIIYCTRVPVAEVDRGTIDVLLGWPISRRTLYAAESIGWLISCVLLVAMTTVGYLAASRVIAPENRPEFGRVLLVAANLYCMAIAVGGVSYLVSSLSDRRNRAMAIIFAVLAASFFLNFLAQFWEPVKAIEFLSVMTYYQPALVLLKGSIPLGDVAVLLGFGATAWLLGGAITVRRNISTV